MTTRRRSSPNLSNGANGAPTPNETASPTRISSLAQGPAVPRTKEDLCESSGVQLLRSPKVEQAVAPDVVRLLGRARCPRLPRPFLANVAFEFHPTVPHPGTGQHREQDDSLPPLTHTIRHFLPNWVAFPLIYFLLGTIGAQWLGFQRPFHLGGLFALLGWLTNHLSVAYSRPDPFPHFERQRMTVEALPSELDPPAARSD